MGVLRRKAEPKKGEGIKRERESKLTDSDDKGIEDQQSQLL